MSTASNLSSSRNLNGMRIFSWMLIILLTGIAIDLYGLLRINAFEKVDHETRHTSGYFSLVPVRKHGTILHLESKDASYDLSCDAPGLGVSHSCDYRRTPKAGVLTEVDWVFAPGGLFDGALLYPIGVQQNGEQIYQISVRQVAEAQSQRVIGDIEFLCIASGFVSLLLIFGGVRMRMRPIA